MSTGLGEPPAPGSPPAPEIFPLAEVRPGQHGEWRTVVQGTEIRSFPLEVLGVVPNFSGPRRAIIICQALDDENLRSGPVGGMSGSPVYLEGRLAGAYAYGFPWPKEQAILGVTPIEEMLEILHRFPSDPEESAARTGAPRPPAGTRAPAPTLRAATAHPAPGQSWANPATWQPLPTPLVAAGFSGRTLQAFATRLEHSGLSLLGAPAGSGGRATAADLQPGAPVAAVLMDGDFVVAGTGTITYREGDRLLAFGHPFLQFGSADLPLAGAEIITIVRSVQRSFKLSNHGPIVGTIYQDRLTGLAGRLGEGPVPLRLSITLRGAGGEREEYRADLFDHPRLTPLLAAMALAETSGSHLESAEETTLRLSGRLRGRALGEIALRDVAAGPEAGLRLAFDFLDRCLPLFDNPFASPECETVDLELEVLPERRAWTLAEAFLDRATVRAGETVELRLRLRPHRGPDQWQRVPVPIPAGWPRGEKVSVLVADAPTLAQLEGLDRLNPSSLADLVQAWARTRPRDLLGVRLLRRGAGVRLHGSDLSGLPPSLQAQVVSSVPAPGRHRSEEWTAWAEDLALDGEFTGSTRLWLTLE